MKQYALVLLLVCALRGMDESPPAELVIAPGANFASVITSNCTFGAVADGMAEIRKWDDAEGFVECFVAYEQDAPDGYFVHDGCYSQPASPGVSYGYVHGEPFPQKIFPWKGSENGYLLNRLLKSETSEATASTAALVDSKLRVAGVLRMRRATMQEMRAMFDAVQAGQAEFDFFGQDWPPYTLLVAAFFVHQESL